VIDPNDDPGFDPDRLVGCAYWRCGDIFERRTSNQVFCRKACRSRQRKWERAQERKRLRTAAKQNSGLLLLLAASLLFVSECSSASSGGDTSEDQPETTPAAAPDEPTAVTVSPEPPSPEPPLAVASDLVPSVEELVEIGLTTAQAECFIAEIDPEGTGRVGSAELFTAAFAACLT